MTQQSLARRPPPCLKYPHGRSQKDRQLLAFIREHDIKVLNVAGSWGSKEPKVAAFVKPS
jgi:hypothetical protein